LTPIERQQANSSLSGSRFLSRTGIWSLIAVLLFSLADGALLWALPRLRISFATGPEMLPPLVASLLLRLSLLCGLQVARLIVRARGSTRDALVVRRQSADAGAQAQLSPALLLFLATNLAFTGMQIDAYVVEPLSVRITELSLSFDSLDPRAPPVHVVHLTDLHIERNSYREASVLRKVNALQPDIVVLTGDYLNLSRLSDPTSAAHFRQFVAQLDAPYGIYAVRGTVEPSIESMARLVQGTQVNWLEQESVTIDVRGQQIALVGVACSHQPDLDTARMDQAFAQVSEGPTRLETSFKLLLYHSPDLIAEAADRQIDLYLSGHTHGGQIRLPIFGPLATGSRYGRRYVAGLYQAPSDPASTEERGDTWMYNSRGLGLEGGGMPRARFLCPPEIVSIELGGH
jgi:predicted MPP superfamily phosphohydrolase